MFSSAAQNTPESRSWTGSPKGRQVVAKKCGKMTRTYKRKVQSPCMLAAEGRTGETKGAEGQNRTAEAERRPNPWEEGDLDAAPAALHMMIPHLFQETQTQVFSRQAWHTVIRPQSMCQEKAVKDVCFVWNRHLPAHTQFWQFWNTIHTKDFSLLRYSATIIFMRLLF